MVTQTVALLLCLAALAAPGLCIRIFAWFIYSGLPMSGERWPALRVYPVIQVHTAPLPVIVPQLGLASVAAVRAADVDLSVNFTHADPAQLRMSGAQASVTL
jgi:hypothetical protein